MNRGETKFNKSRVKRWFTVRHARQFLCLKKTGRFGLKGEGGGGGGGSKEESRDLCDSVCRGIRLGSLSVQEERRNLSQLGKKGTLCQ